DSNFNFNANKGYTLGAFGQYVLCQGQAQVNALGYSALPINLVLDGYQQLARIPGANIPATSADQIRTCNNPTFSTDGSNTLAVPDPFPPDCDRQGPTQCTTGTGGARDSSDGGGGGGGNGNPTVSLSPGASGDTRNGPAQPCDSGSTSCSSASGDASRAS